jgi:hypothetical protein
MLLIGLALPALIFIALIAMCFAPSGRPTNEPQYQGRYLSEWCTDTVFPGAQFDEPTEALRAIGTNGLPCYLKWMRYEPSAWKLKLRSKLPRWAKTNQMISEWFGQSAAVRAYYSVCGFQLLGSNAVSAIPELTTMIGNSSHPETAQRAMRALSMIGEEAIPAFRTALADTNHVFRSGIIARIQYLGCNGYSNACVPILLELLNDPDSVIRADAITALYKVYPNFVKDMAARGTPRE